MSMRRYSLSLTLDVGGHTCDEDAREAARALVLRLPLKAVTKIHMRGHGGRAVLLRTGTPAASVETRPCSEPGCKIPVTRPSGTGRWPDRCPEHRAKHIAAESARRVAASRARRKHV